MKSKMSKIIMVGFSILLGFFICESILRIAKPIKLVGISHQPCIYEKSENTGYIYMKNSKGWMHRNFEIDNTVITNSDGFHDIERNNNTDSDIHRIAVIGDSLTASIHVPTSATWTQILENELQEKNKALLTEVINLGLDGTSTNIQFNILSAYLKTKKINTVILAFYNNDMNGLMFQKIYRENHDGYVITYQNNQQRNKMMKYIDNERPSFIIRVLYNKSFFIRSIMRALEKDPLLKTNFIKPSHVDGDLLKMQENPRHLVNKYFRKLFELSKKNKFALYIMPIPAKSGINGSYDMLMSNLSVQHKSNLLVINLAKPISDLLYEYNSKYSQLFWKFDGHFNAKGNEIIGLAAARELIPMIMND